MHACAVVEPRVTVVSKPELRMHARNVSLGHVWGVPARSRHSFGSVFIPLGPFEWRPAVCPHLLVPAALKTKSAATLDYDYHPPWLESKGERSNDYKIIVQFGYVTSMQLVCICQQLKSFSFTATQFFFFSCEGKERQMKFQLRDSSFVSRRVCKQIEIFAQWKIVWNKPGHWLLLARLAPRPSAIVLTVLLATCLWCL